MYGKSKELNTYKHRLRKFLVTHSKDNQSDHKGKATPEAKHHQEEGNPGKPKLEILPETHLEAKQKDLQNVNDLEKEAKDMSFTEFIEYQGWRSISMDFLKDLNTHKIPTGPHDSSRMNIDKQQTDDHYFNVDNDYVAKQRAKWSNFFGQQKKTPLELHLEKPKRQKQKTEPVKKTRGKFPPRRSLSALYRSPRQTHRMRKAMESIAEQSRELSDAGKCTCSQCDLSRANGAYIEYVD